MIFQPTTMTMTLSDNDVEPGDQAINPAGGGNGNNPQFPQGTIASDGKNLVITTQVMHYMFRPMTTEDCNVIRFFEEYDFFFFHGGEGGDGLSSQGVPSEPSRLVSQCFLSQRHCVLGITPLGMLSSANYRPQWVPYRLLQPHTLAALPWGQATQVGEGQHVSLDQPPFCTLPSQATVR